MKKVYESYETLKKSYKGILAQEDIEECFQNDEVLFEVKKSVKKSEITHLVLWICFLLSLLVIVENISVAPIIWSFVKEIFR